MSRGQEIIRMTGNKKLAVPSIDKKISEDAQPRIPNLQGGVCKIGANQ